MFTNDHKDIPIFVHLNTIDMNFKTSILVITIIICSLASHAQKRIGYVLEIDSVMKHQYLGISSFQNFSNIYPMPFELQPFTNESVHHILAGSKIVLISIEEDIIQEYLMEEAQLSRKEKKAFRKVWLEELKQEKKLDGFLFINSSQMKPYQQENIAIELGKVGFIQSNKNTYIRVYLQMEIKAFGSEKPHSIKAKTKYLKQEGFPSLRSKNTRFTEEELQLSEKAYHQLIQIQLQELHDSKSFSKYLNSL